MTNKFTLALLFMCTVWSASLKAQSAMPRPEHIIVLIEENQPNSFVIGNSAAPYINQLTQDSIAATFTQAYGIEHPSQGDYLDLFAGSNQGVLDDNVPVNYPFTTPNLARQLLDNGLTFVTYSQNLPSVGYDGASSNGYVRKHNPVTNWVGTGTNQVPPSTNQPFSNFPVNFDSLPTISYVVPVEDSDMHNGFGNPTIKAGDKWMSNNLTGLINWVKTHNALFIYTFDEDDGFFGNNIPTVFYGPMVKGGSYSNHIDLYSMLRTMEDMYHLPYAGNAANATPITNCWRSTSTGIAQVGTDTKLKVYPNPSAQHLTFESNSQSGSAEINITDISGRMIAQYLMNGPKLKVSTAEYPSGLYFFQYNAEGVTTNGKFSVSR